MTPIAIELAQRGTGLALEVVYRRDPATPPPSSLNERITATLAGADAALPFAQLRACCRVRATTLYQRLAVLADTGRVVKNRRRISPRQRLIPEPATITTRPPTPRLPSSRFQALYNVTPSRAAAVKTGPL
jgi:hypothetical protein